MNVPWNGAEVWALMVLGLWVGVGRRKVYGGKEVWFSEDAHLLQVSSDVTRR